MTSSPKQTDGAASGHRRFIGAVVVGVALVAGCVLILHGNRYRIGPPVVFLWMGWLGVLLSGLFLWRAGWAAADDEGDDEDFWKPTGERDDLKAEKRTLLKAIKEIEFDHQMGKMSDSDAKEMTQLYRARAIQVIKALEQSKETSEEPGSVRDEIERELKARMRVAKAAKKKLSAEKPENVDAPAAEERVDVDVDDDEADDEAEVAEVDADAEVAADADAEPDADADAEPEPKSAPKPHAAKSGKSKGRKRGKSKRRKQGKSGAKA